MAQIKIIVFLIGILVSFTASAQNFAYVIIDMQPIFSTRNGFHKSPDNKAKIKKSIDNIIEMIELAKSENLPILLIEFKSYGKTDRRIRRALWRYQNVEVFQKSYDSFADAKNAKAENLFDVLNEAGIDSLIVSGANGGACVRCSLQSALDAGFKVYAETESIVDFNIGSFRIPYTYGTHSLNLKDPEKLKNFVQLKGITDVEKLLSGVSFEDMKLQDMDCQQLLRKQEFDMEPYNIGWKRSS